MEQENKPMNFTSLNKGQNSNDFSIGNLAVKGKTKKVVTSTKRAKLTDEIIKKLNNTEIIPISKGVSVVLFKDKGVILNSESNLLDIILVEKNYPDAFVGLLPSLYEDFIVNDIIKPFVKIGDIVTIQRKYVQKNGDIPRKVIDVYFKALNNMTVIIAELEDGDLVLTNTLIKQ